MIIDYPIISESIENFVGNEHDRILSLKKKKTYPKFSSHKIGIWKYIFFHYLRKLSRFLGQSSALVQSNI